MPAVKGWLLLGVLLLGGCGEAASSAKAAQTEFSRVVSDGSRHFNSALERSTASCAAMSSPACIADLESARDAARNWRADVDQAPHPPCLADVRTVTAGAVDYYISGVTKWITGHKALAPGLLEKGSADMQRGIDGIKTVSTSLSLPICQ